MARDKARAAEYQREWYQKNKVRVAEAGRVWRAAHREREAARCRAWRAANPEKKAAINRKYRAANPEKVAACNRAWRQANPDKARAYGSKWRQDNRGRFRRNQMVSEMRRRAKLASAPGRGVTARDVADLFEGSLGLCAYCNTSNVRLVVDHIEPISTGGAHDPENLAAVCAQCNSSKGNTPLLVWLAVRARGVRN